LSSDDSSTAYSSRQATTNSSPVVRSHRSAADRTSVRPVRMTADVSAIVGDT
jgi:hypothetical protein